MIAQPSGPKAVAIVSRSPKVAAAQRMISTGSAPSNSRLAAARSAAVRDTGGWVVTVTETL